jgi:hypothetical protein
MAIPYYARTNREHSEESDRRGRGEIRSSVWLKAGVRIENEELRIKNSKF